MADLYDFKMVQLPQTFVLQKDTGKEFESPRPDWNDQTPRRMKEKCPLRALVQKISNLYTHIWRRAWIQKKPGCGISIVFAVHQSGFQPIRRRTDMKSLTYSQALTGFFLTAQARRLSPHTISDYTQTLVKKFGTDIHHSPRVILERLS